jgi:hypothetical protein
MKLHHRCQLAVELICMGALGLRRLEKNGNAKSHLSHPGSTPEFCLRPYAIEKTGPTCVVDGKVREG